MTPWRAQSDAEYGVLSGIRARSRGPRSDTRLTRRRGSSKRVTTWRSYLSARTNSAAALDDRRTVTLVAETGRAIVGTLTIRLDGPRALLADESYSAHVSALRSEGRRVCELPPCPLPSVCPTYASVSLVCDRVDNPSAKSQ
jgi:hypothetical protein